MDKPQPHPAKYSDPFLPIFASILENRKLVFDPMAGTGKLALIKDYGFTGQVYCNEIEPEWINREYRVDQWFNTDATDLSFIKSDTFDAICTSPTYGNRMADGFNAKSKYKRISYSEYLSRTLHKSNTGQMQWGSNYRQTHTLIYAECARVLALYGLFVLNISDHIRKYQIIPVADWHKNLLLSFGFLCLNDQPITTHRMRYGRNSELRIATERIITFIRYK